MVCRYVGVERTLYIQHRDWSRVEPQPRTVVRQMVYRRAFGTLWGAGQGTLDLTCERTHAKQPQVK
jgi:hypothetical protein